MISLESTAALFRQWAHEQPTVDAIWLFGSVAKGTARDSSDVDVAILFSQGSVPSPSSRLELMMSLGECVGRDVDLVILNTAGELITNQILRYGQCVYSRTPLRTALFALAESGKYTDYQVMKNTIIAAVKRPAHG